jgi:predicted dienelactone hydrolase
MRFQYISQFTKSALAWTIFLVAMLGTQHAQAQFSAGFQQTRLATSATENIEVAIWYPSNQPEAVLMRGPFTMRVSNNSEPIQKKHPLVMLSHGTGGMSFTHHEIAAATARAGFVVVALTHPGDNYQDRSMVGKLDYLTERPRQVSRTLDAVLADAKWASFVDVNRIAFVGHSAGGFTGLALLGATPSIANSVKHCAVNFDADVWFCQQFGSKEKAIDTAKDLSALPTVAGSKDARFKAAVLISPVGIFSEAAALASLTTPTLVYVALRDTVLTPKFHAQAVGEGLPNSTVVVNTQGGHFMLASKLNVPSGTPTGIKGAEVNDEPVGFDRGTAIAEAGVVIPKFLTEKLGL